MVIKKLCSCLKPSNITDNTQKLQSDFLIIILISAIILGSTISVLTFLAHWGNLHIVILSQTILSLFLLFLNKTGKTYIASMLLVSFLSLFTVVYLLYYGQGIHDYSIIIFPLITLVASLLLNTLFYVIINILIVLSIGFVTYANIVGLVQNPYSEFTSVTAFAIISLFLVVQAVAVRLLNNTLLQQLEKARNNEQKYKNIIESIQEIYFELTPNGKILELSPSINIKTEFERDHYINKSSIKFFQDFRKYDELIKIINKLGYVKNFQVDVITPNKKEYTTTIDARIIHDEYNNPVKIIGTMKDITQLKKLQDQIYQMQKMESMGTLASGIAQDFENLLTIINNHSENAISKIASDHSAIDDLKTIYNTGEKAICLTRQLLLLSKKQSAKIKILDINQNFKDLDEMIKRLVNDDIEIKIKLDNSIKTIKANPGQLEQIVINLVLNAQEALNAKGPDYKKEIIIETQNKTLDDHYIQEQLGIKSGTYVQISFSDNGTGMDKDIQNNIFEPFFTTKEKGTGLGLTLVYNIIKQNNGMIYVYSEKEKGTTFHILWPVATKSEKQFLVKETTISQYYGNESIMLVEDDKNILEFTTEVLKSFGYRVFGFSNGRIALEKLVNQSKIDLIITDYIMPEINGDELAKRALKIDPTINILFMSGYSKQAMSNSTVKNFTFLQKPFTVHDLAHKVYKALGNKP